jgi:hypothetical protein
MQPPQTATFDPINRHASLSCSCSASTSTSASSVSQPSDLVHVASIVQGLIAIIQPHSQLAPSTTNNKPASDSSAPPSPLRNTPSKLRRYLQYAEESLNVNGATAYEESPSTQGYGPDILHLVNGATLLGLGLSEGDVIRLKQNLLRWWSLESKSNKHKWPDEDVGGLTQPPPEPRTPPNMKVQFEKKFHSGGGARLYGLQITPGRLRPGQDFDWHYFCEVCGRFVPLPDGYVPVLDGVPSDLDDGF